MKILITFMLLIMTQVIYAHQDRILYKNEGNLHFEYEMGWLELEINNKINIFFHLAEALINTKNYKNIPFYICFKHDYTKSETSYQTLGYGTFKIREDWKGNTLNKNQSEGVKLVIQDKDFKIKELLQLLNASFLNKELIEKNQKEVIIDLKSIINGKEQYDTLYSIENHLIENFKKQSDEVIDQLIKRKTYRYLKPTYTQGIDYYYQNDQFYFYDKDNINEKRGDNIILELDNIHEIFGDLNGNFVFTNDSTFYFIDGYSRKAKGQFIISTLKKGRSPVYKYYYENTQLEKYFLLFINHNYMGFDKILYLPDSNIVVLNYGNYEEKLIKELLKNKSEKTKTIKCVKEDKISTLFIIIVLSILINIWLIKSKL